MGADCDVAAADGGGYCSVVVHGGHADVLDEVLDEIGGIVMVVGRADDGEVPRGAFHDNCLDDGLCGVGGEPEEDDEHVSGARKPRRADGRQFPVPLVC